MTNATASPAQLSQEETARLLRLATYASTSVAVFLIAAKLFAWASSDSVSLLATLIDSILDALASLINLVASSARPRQTGAPLWSRQGRPSPVSASHCLSPALPPTCCWKRQSVLNPVAVESIALGIWVMVLSIVATLLPKLPAVIRKTNSTAIRADALHYKADLLVNGSVIVALALASFGWYGFDGVFGAAIGLYILFSAREIIITSCDHLMDRELPDEQREQIERWCWNTPVHGVFMIFVPATPEP